jgi:hypothetical protein
MIFSLRCGEVGVVGGMGEFSHESSLRFVFSSTEVFVYSSLFGATILQPQMTPAPPVKYISIVVHIECPLSPSFIFHFSQTMVLQWTWAKVRICIIGIWFFIEENYNSLYWRKVIILYYWRKLYFFLAKWRRSRLVEEDTLATAAHKQSNLAGGEGGGEALIIYHHGTAPSL